MKKLISTIILIFVSFTIFAYTKQDSIYTEFLSYDYRSIDAKVKKINSKKLPLDTLIKKIDKLCKNDAEKIRAVYLWVETNISYNLKLKYIGLDANKMQHTFGGSKKELTIKEKQTIKYLDSVSNENTYQVTYKKRTGVCGGISELFKYMLTKLNVETIVITGVYSYGYSVPMMPIFPHGWNSVSYKGVCLLFDVTNKQFAALPEKFIINCIPDSKNKWFEQLKNPCSNEECYTKRFVGIPNYTFISKYKFDICFEPTYYSNLTLKNCQIVEYADKAWKDNKMCKVTYPNEGFYKGNYNSVKLHKTKKDGYFLGDVNFKFVKNMSEKDLYNQASYIIRYDTTTCEATIFDGRNIITKSVRIIFYENTFNIYKP